MIEDEFGVVARAFVKKIEEILLDNRENIEALGREDDQGVATIGLSLKWSTIHTTIPHSVTCRISRGAYKETRMIEHEDLDHATDQIADDQERREDVPEEVP